MALADIYQLIHKQTIDGIPVENVYFYERSASSIDHADLQAGFITDVLPSILQLQCGIAHSLSIDVQSLGNTSDFGSTILVGQVGQRGEPSLPAFNAVGYTLRSADRAVRPGSKRIAAVPETSVTVGVITDSAYLTYVETARLALDAYIDVGSENFHPVIVKRIKTAIAGTTPVKYKYTLPKAGDPLVIATLLGVLANTHVTSQVSRKS